MKIFEYNLDEISTPTGTIYIRFREKVGEREMINGQIRNRYYLTAFAGFANAPEELKRENALRNFSINKAEDLVHMIKTIFSDKTFISVKKVVLYDDLTNDMQGPRTPVYKRNPYLLKFFEWVEREGGDKIELVGKVHKEGPPKIKRPKKENPNKGRKIRDIPQGETKKTVTFTVSPRFYREIQNNLPNIMRYRGPEGTFVMPNELFMAFRKQAEEKFPFADIKIQQRVATGENLENEGYSDSFYRDAQRGGMSRAEDKGYYDGLAGRYRCPYPNGTKEQEDYDHGYSNGREYSGDDEDDDENFESIPGTFVSPSPAARQQARAVMQKDADAAVVGRAKMGITDVDEGSDKSAHDCGIVDGYYGRRPDPHKIEMGKRVKLTDLSEIKAYMAGYNDDSVGSKVYESEDPMDKDARDSYGSRAPGVKKLKDGKYHAVNADGEHKIFASKEQAERHAKKRKTNEDGMDMMPSSDHEASMAKGELYNTVKNAKELFHMIKDGENLEGWVASKITRAADYINTVHDYMMYEKQYNESMNEVGDTKRGQKLINKVHKRASDRLGKAADKGDIKNARKYQDVMQQAWDRMPADKWDESLNERSTSEKQARTMAAAAHDPKFAKKLGIKQSVAKEFNKADKGTKRLSNAMKKEDVTDEAGPASRSLCRSKKPDSALGASNLASCVSQGLRAHKSGRADYVNGKQLRVGGKKIKGKAHGGPLPDYS